MATQSDSIRNAYRLALTIDATGGGSILHDELVAILASAVPFEERAKIIQGVENEFGDWFDLQKSATLTASAPLRLPPRGTRRQEFLVFAAFFIGFLSGMVVGYRAADIVHRTQPAVTPAREAPAMGVAMPAAAAAEATLAAIPGTAGHG